MAKGDAFNALTGDSVSTDIRPASGVEVVITGLRGNSTMTLAWDDATNISSDSGSTADAITQGFSNTKFFVTNTIFLQITSTSGRTGYSGVVTK